MPLSPVVVSTVTDEVQRGTLDLLVVDTNDGYEPEEGIEKVRIAYKSITGDVKYKTFVVRSSVEDENFPLNCVDYPSGVVLS